MEIVIYNLSHVDGSAAWHWDLRIKGRKQCGSDSFGCGKRDCINSAKRMCAILLPACKVMLDSKIIYELS